jgi:hypothetical protein
MDIRILLFDEIYFVRTLFAFVTPSVSEILDIAHKNEFSEHLKFLD